MQIKNVVIINDFNYIQGGASKIALQTAEILAKKGKNVYFFSAVNDSEKNIEGITYISTNQNEALKDKNKLRGFINGIYNLKSRKKLKELLLRLDRNETVIHIHGWTKALSSSVFDVAFKMNYKVVLTLHDYFSACPNGGYYNYKDDKICELEPLTYSCIKCNCDSRNYFFKLYRVLRTFVQNKIVKLNKKIENVISISELSEKILKTTLGENVNITRIYNPLEFSNDIEETMPMNNCYYIYVGRVSKEKGVDIFCQAIEELGVHGIVVGDGDQKEILEKKYNTIEFVGWKNSNEVKEYMKNAKALIFPSKWYETAGLTVLESQSLGIPCVVYKKCAGSEFVKNKNLKFSNLNELKEIIVNLDKNVKKYFDITMEFDKFSFMTYEKNLLDLYEKI